MSDAYLIDTGILIAFYNRGLFQERYLALLGLNAVSFSVVSLNEFIRGAHDLRSKHLVRSFADIVATRLLTPTQQQWLECGSIAQSILHSGKRPKESVVLLQNDILIALSARDANLRLITADKKDFTLLSRHIDFDLEIWKN